MLPDFDEQFNSILRQHRKAAIFNLLVFIAVIALFGIALYAVNQLEDPTGQGCELPPAVAIGSQVFVSGQLYIVERQVRVECGKRWYECFLFNDPNIRIVTSTDKMTIAAAPEVFDRQYK